MIRLQCNRRTPASDTRNLKSGRRGQVDGRRDLPTGWAQLDPTRRNGDKILACAGVLVAGLVIVGLICFRQEKWPLRIGMTRNEVEEAFGPQVVCWDGSWIDAGPDSQERRRKAMEEYKEHYSPTGDYWSKPDENGLSVIGYFEFDSNNRLVRWKIEGDSRPQWLEVILKPLGW